MGGNNEFFDNFERNKYLKKIPSMQRVKIINYNGVPKQNCIISYCRSNLYSCTNLLSNTRKIGPAPIMHFHGHL